MLRNTKEVAARPHNEVFLQTRGFKNIKGLSAPRSERMAWLFQADKGKEPETVNYTDKQSGSTMIHTRKWERHRTQPWITEDSVKRHTEKLWFTPEDREKTVEKLKRKEEKAEEAQKKEADAQPAESKDDAEPKLKRSKPGEMAAPARIPRGGLPVGVEAVDCGGKGNCGYRALSFIKQTIEARKNRKKTKPDATDMGKMRKQF